VYKELTMSSFAAAYLIVWLATTLYILRLGLHQHRLARAPHKDSTP
jgi:CcmD family protein